MLYSDYQLIKSGILSDYAENKRERSAIAFTSTFTAWANGMGQSKNGKNMKFKQLVKKLGLLDNSYIKKKTDEVDRKEQIKLARENAENILKDILK
jgi:hypothetical protein